MLAQIPSAPCQLQPWVRPDKRSSHESWEAAYMLLIMSIMLWTSSTSIRQRTTLRNWAVLRCLVRLLLFGIVFDMTPDAKLMYIPLKEEDSIAVVDTAKVIAHDPTALAAKIGAGISPFTVVVRPGTPTPAGRMCQCTRCLGFHSPSAASTTPAQPA